MKAEHSVTFTVTVGYHLPVEPAVGEEHAIGTIKGIISRMAGSSVNMVTIEDVTIGEPKKK